MTKPSLQEDDTPIWQIGAPEVPDWVRQANQTSLSGAATHAGLHPSGEWWLFDDEGALVEALWLERPV